MPPTIIRDLSDTSGYWAAIWTMCVMPDVHVICDAPIGCFNLVGTAVPDYTDAIPHIENLTPATMTEQEVGGKGTGPTVVRTWEGLRDTGVLDGKHLIVVSTAESEMIGADHGALVKTLSPGTLFYYSNSLAEDEWAGRDRVLRWLWEHYGEPPAGRESGGVPQNASSSSGLGEERVARNAQRVNIIGPTYGCFNAPSDLHELKRLIGGAGGTLNLVYPYEARLADTPRLADGAVNVVMYREFGAGLAEQLGRPVLYAPFGMRGTTEFVRELGRLLGTEQQAEEFIRLEKRTTLQPLWDLWRGPQSDWFSTSSVAIAAGRSYADGLAGFLGEELGMPVQFVSGRPLRRDEPGNEEVRQALHKAAPAFVFGSINEKIYLSEAGARFTHFLPAAFPLPIVRRALGTPFMGYSGAVYLAQEIVNRLYEALFNFMPVDGAYARGATQPAASMAAVRWQPEAKALLDAELEKLPFIPRISASRNLQMQTEALAQQQGVAEVTPEVVEAALAQTQCTPFERLTQRLRICKDARPCAILGFRLQTTKHFPLRRHSEPTTKLPRIKENAMRALRPLLRALAGILLTLRLALPKIGVGWMFALLTSNFNQIAIYDLAVPAVIVTVMVGLHHFLSPFQVIFGRLADRHPVFGYRRTPYILLGSLFSSCVFLFLPTIAIGMGSGSMGATAAGYALLLVFGVSIAMMGDAHHSLIAERVGEKRRGAVIGVAWTLTIASGIAGGIFLKLNLPVYDPATMQAIYSTTPMIVLGASLLGVLGVERRLNRLEQQATIERSRVVAPGSNGITAAITVLRTNAQARIFWCFVFMAILAIFLQDQILEVFGREVFAMTLQDAQGIQPVWGGGVLLGMLSMGLLSAFVPIRKKTIAILGSAGTALGMGMLALTALLQQQSLLTPTLMLMGFSTGLFNVGALSMMMDMTVDGATGLYMGMWGVAQAFGTGISSMLSGALKTGLIESGLVSPAFGYTAIFGLETVLMVVAIALLSSVSVAEFRGFTRADVARAMELGTA